MSPCRTGQCGEGPAALGLLVSFLCSLPPIKDETKKKPRGGAVEKTSSSQSLRSTGPRGAAPPGHRSWSGASSHAWCLPHYRRPTHAEKCLVTAAHLLSPSSRISKPLACMLAARCPTRCSKCGHVPGSNGL